jgi:hypothetical protein
MELTSAEAIVCLLHPPKEVGGTSRYISVEDDNIATSKHFGVVSSEGRFQMFLRGMYKYICLWFFLKII